MCNCIMTFPGMWTFFRTPWWHGMRGSCCAIPRRESYPQRVVANLIFAPRPLSSPGWVGNLTGHYDTAARHLRKPYAFLEELDLAPRDSLVAAPGIPSGCPDADLGFTQATRASSEIGACQSDLPKGDCGAGVLNRWSAP